MSAHPELSLEDAQTIMSYILTLGDKKTDVKYLPLEGSINFTEHMGKKVAGKYILMASYRDKGNEGQPNSSISEIKQIIFTPLTYSYIASNGNVDDDISGMIEIIKSDATYKVVFISDEGKATNLTDVKVNENVVTGLVALDGSEIEISMRIEKETITGTALLPNGAEFKITGKIEK
jgi:hypothetical protein